MARFHLCFFKPPNVLIFGLLEDTVDLDASSMAGPLQSWDDLIPVDAPVSWRGLQPIHCKVDKPHFVTWSKTKQLEDVGHFQCNQPRWIPSWSIEESSSNSGGCTFPSPLGREPQNCSNLRPICTSCIVVLGIHFGLGNSRTQLHVI